MTRLDEALARARAARPEDIVPPATATTDQAFPEELPASTSVGLSEELPSEELLSEPVAVADAAAPAPAPTVMPPVKDLRNLGNAEKLSPTSKHASSVEQYRRLAARLHLMQAEHQTSVVMVTSAVAGEGKTLTAANLALTLSESYRRSVLLIDADLRRPSLHTLFGVENVSGLSDALKAAEARKLTLVELTDQLSLLPAGRPDNDPMSVLSSERMRQVIAEAGKKFEWVIIDTPPVGLLTDARLLASAVDTVLLVVQAGKTPLAAIKAAGEAIGRERILGVVLNRAEKATVHDSYAYYYAGSVRA
jgi:capsular exopolysaccharide synthesis family protein